MSRKNPATGRVIARVRARQASTLMPIAQHELNKRMSQALWQASATPHVEFGEPCERVLAILRERQQLADELFKEPDSPSVWYVARKAIAKRVAAALRRLAAQIRRCSERIEPDPELRLDPRCSTPDLLVYRARSGSTLSISGRIEDRKRGKS